MCGWWKCETHKKYACIFTPEVNEQSANFSLGEALT